MGNERLVILICFVTSTIVSFFLVFLVRKWAVRYGIVDIPNPRSSHTKPTPRCGGVAIVLGSLTGIVLVSLFSLYNIKSFQGLFLGASLIAIVGLLDDLMDLPAKFRVLAQLVAASILTVSGIKLVGIQLPIFGIVPLGIFAIPITVLWVIWMTNLYNFMDGTDGLAAGEAIIAGLFLAFIAWINGNPFILLMCLLVVGGSFGFLLHNFPPAKIFMGDVGSSFLGFVFAALAIIGAQSKDGYIAFIIPVLLLGTFIFDTGVTLVRRILKGEKWFSAHRSHYYQRLTNLGYSHKDVALIECIVTTLLGLSAIAYLKVDEAWQLLILIGWLVILSSLALSIRFCERRDFR